jgi:membrane protease YdiL (CAAX protease family)
MKLSTKRLVIEMKILRNPTLPEIVTIVILCCLLLLSVPYNLVIGLLRPTVPDWISELHQFSLYLLLYPLLLIYRSNLRDYHIGKVTLWAFILSGTVLRIGPFSIITLLFWIAGTTFFILYIKGYFHIESQTNSIMWLIVSCLIGILLPLIFILILGPNTFNEAKAQPNLFAIVKNFAIELTWVALFEETVFRGFLWGFLAKKGWKGKNIFLSQAVLFWSAHLYFVKSNPLFFWMIVPTITLILGWLAWRSKSVGPGMFMHALFNTFLLYY